VHSSHQSSFVCLACCVHTRTRARI
jgi:hypothetical protein